MLQLGDIKEIDGGEIEPVDIICMGSPCQDLSVAGRQEGLKGERSGLFHRGIDIVQRMRTATGGRYPRYVVWENVPGAFSSNKGMDFRAVLQSLTKTDIPIPRSRKWATAGVVRSKECEVAWRQLDAQYWGVPQRRKRIFLVADFRADGRCAGQILFERESLSGNTQTSREAKQGTAAEAESDTGATIWDSYNHGGWRRANKTGSVTTGWGRVRGGTPIICLNDQGGARMDVCVDKMSTLTARMYKSVPIVAYEIGAAMSHQIVRRLTPLECERLQGLPDNYTLIADKSCSDSARYKALGNGMAQPCADWIIKRIVEAMKA